MLQKPLLVGLCVVAWILFFGVFLGASRARTFHDIPKWRACSQAMALMSQFKQDSRVLNIPF